MSKIQSKKPITAVSRLKQDYLRLKKDPVPYIVAEPLPSNILEWYYVVRGPENTPYDGGLYLGKLVFPREFPFKPPSIYMITPNGRFKTNTRLCLSISDFHPDTWNPAWSVSTILTGLLSFMIEKSPTLGSIETSDFERRQLAAKSLIFNLADRQFCELFPDLVQKIKTDLERKAEAELARTNTIPGATGEVGNDSLATIRDQLGGGGGNIARARDQYPFHGAITNLCVIIGFAAFAYTVKYVLRSIAAELP